MGLKRRVARISEKLGAIVKRRQLASCNCLDFFFASPLNPRKFEEEMNRSCPAHGVRSLGRINEIRFVKAVDGRPDTSAPKEAGEIELERLFGVYYAQCEKIDSSGTGHPK